MGRLKSFVQCFKRDQDGAALVEVTVLIPILMIFLLGAIDFSFLFYYRAVATKAVEMGARIAAVSDPVASGLNSMSTSVVGGSVAAGDPMPPFQVTCDGATASCTCTQGTCPGMGTFSWVGMNEIVCGRDNTSSTECAYSPLTDCKPTSNYFTGMCDLFRNIKARNVKIVYTGTGLGFAGRSGGPVPTITVSLQNLNFQYFFLNGLLGFQTLNNITAAQTTTTGEILSSAAQP